MEDGVNKLLFSESNQPWSSIPNWASFLIDLGYQATQDKTKRRIVLISMPCDSAGSGLVALGAVRHRMEDISANDLDSHFARLLEPSPTKSGVPLLDLRVNGRRRGPFLLDGVQEDTDPKFVWVKHAKLHEYRVAITPISARHWKFADEPAVDLATGETLVHAETYDALQCGSEDIAHTNLSRSDSGICIVGRVMGRRATRACFGQVCFRTGERVSVLDELLTVHGWGPDAVSRVTFLNARDLSQDRPIRSPSVAVFDGDAAFLKCFDTNEFSESTCICLYHRITDRSRMEAFAQKVEVLTQWYEEVEPGSICNGPPPRGMNIKVLGRRGEG